MKNKHKVILALLLAFVLVLTACGSKGGNNDADKDNDNDKDGTLKGEITVQAEEEWVDYYQAAIDKIVADNPDVTITIKEVGAFDHLDVLDNTDATNTDIADVFAVPADRVEGLVQNDVLAALDAPEMAKEIGGWDDFEGGLASLFKYDGEYLAFPYNIETLATFINTENAERLNIDYTKPMEITDVDDPATILLPMFDAWYGVAPNNAGGIDLLRKDGNNFTSTYASSYGELNEDQKAVFDAIYEYWKLHNDKMTPLFDADSGWSYIDEEFKTGGNGVARLGGPWDAAKFNEDTNGKLAIYPIGHLTIAGKELTHWQGGWALVANGRIEEDANKMAIARALIKEIVNPENAEELYKATGKILENVSAEDYEASDLPDLDKKVISNIIKSYNVSEPRPTFKEYGSVWDTWENAVLSWNSETPATPEEAYKLLEAAFTAMMEQIEQ